jgi:hypothetical protein
MKRLKISDWIFSGLVLAIAIGGVFASEYRYGDYQIGALAAAIGIFILWIVYDAARQQEWRKKILDFFSERCDCGGREFMWISTSPPINNLFSWAHFYCPECKRFFRRIMPISILMRDLRGDI